MDYMTARAILLDEKDPGALLRNCIDISRLTMGQEDWRELFALALWLWEEDRDRLESV